MVKSVVKRKYEKFAESILSNQGGNLIVTHINFSVGTIVTQKSNNLSSTISNKTIHWSRIYFKTHTDFYFDTKEKSTTYFKNSIIRSDLSIKVRLNKWSFKKRRIWVN